MSLRSRRILITAGPTWVAIDAVRVISNTASGETGTLLAETLKKAGADVTLCLGPCARAVHKPGIRVLPFKFFHELKKILEDELRHDGYDAVIHAAAVSDFRPASAVKSKISSGKNITLRLTGTPKLISMIRKLHSGALIGFKYEPGAAPKTLIAEGRDLLYKSDCELVVANTTDKEGYRAFLVSRQGLVPEIRSKKDLAGLLGMYLRALPDRATETRCSCEQCAK